MITLPDKMDIARYALFIKIGKPFTKKVIIIKGIKTKYIREEAGTMAKKFKVPKNPQEVMKWINSIPMYKEDQPLDLSFKSKEEIRAAQDTNLVKQMERLEKFSPYYRVKFKEWGLDPKSIKTVDDLVKIPLTSKADYSQ